MIIKTQAFVLRNFRFKESSLIVTLYSKECGKVKAVCKGVYRPKSRKGSHFEPLNLIDITLYDKPNRELQLVTDSSIVNYYADVREHFMLHMNVTYVLELIDRMTQTHLPNDTLFKLMHTYFGSVTPSNAQVFTLAFELKLLKVLGIFPNMTQCVLCKEPIITPMGISFHQGGIICDRPSCIHTYHGTRGITREDIVFLFKLIKDPFDEIRRYAFETAEVGKIKELISGYIDYITDNKLKTLKVLKEIQNNTLEPC